MSQQDIKYKKLVSVHELQKNIVKQCIHDIQSPLSAITGYLELMNVCLNSGGETEKMDRYRKQISKGIFEISDILQQIRTVHDEEFSDGTDDVPVEVDLCWVVENICTNLQKISFRKDQHLFFKNSAKSLHISADLILLNMVLYNLIVNAIKYTPANGEIAVDVNIENSRAVVDIHSDTTERAADKILTSFQQESNKDERIDSSQKSFFFGVQCGRLINGEMKMKPDENEGLKVSFVLLL